MGNPKLFYIWGKNVEKILATSCIQFQTGVIDVLKFIFEKNRSANSQNRLIDWLTKLVATAKSPHTHTAICCTSHRGDFQVLFLVQFPNSVPVTLLLDLTLNFGGRWNKLACQKKRPFHWGRPIRVTKFSVRSRSMVKISSSGTILIPVAVSRPTELNGLLGSYIVLLRSKQLRFDHVPRHQNILAKVFTTCDFC